MFADSIIGQVSDEIQSEYGIQNVAASNRKAFVDQYKKSIPILKHQLTQVINDPLFSVQNLFFGKKSVPLFTKNGFAGILSPEPSISIANYFMLNNTVSGLAVADWAPTGLDEEVRLVRILNNQGRTLSTSDKQEIQDIDMSATPQRIGRKGIIPQVHDMSIDFFYMIKDAHDKLSNT